MRFIFPLFLLTILAVSGCTKKAQTASTERPPGRTVAPVATGNSPVFVTGRPAEGASVPVPPTEAPVAAVHPETLVPITFPEKETEHVRIVDYNPFGSADQLTLRLEDIGQYFCYPYPGNMISDYGMRGRSMHTGVDIKAIPNDTVRAALSGVVRMSKVYSGYGNIVVIRHPCGLETAYAHNSKNLVRPNDVVRAGDPIALAGRTGRATTEHVHFEVRIMGEHFDPNLLLDTQNRTIRDGDLCLSRKNGRVLASRVGGTVVTQEAPVTLTTAPAPRNGTTATSSAGVYVVQKGDTLYSISRQHGLTVDQICALNGIPRDGVLSIGQRLKMK